MKDYTPPNSQSTRATLMIASALAGCPPVAPIYISSLNSVDVLGQSWRWARSVAKQLGVPIITPPGSSKSLIPAAALIEALERAGRIAAAERPTEPPPAGSDEEYLAMCRAAGLAPTRAA